MNAAFTLGRIALVAIFIISGAQKLLDIAGTADYIQSKVTIPAMLTETTGQIEAAVGMPIWQVLAIVVALIEVVGGLLIAFNVLTRAAANLPVLFVVAYRPAAEPGGALGIELTTAPEGAYMIRLPAGGAKSPPSSETIARGEHFIRMEGRETYRFAKHRALADDVLKSERLRSSCLLGSVVGQPYLEGVSEVLPLTQTTILSSRYR